MAVRRANRPKRPDPNARSVAARYTPTGDADFIALARKRFKQAESADEEQRERELEDLEFYAGKQWPQDVLNAREGQPGNAQSGLPPVPARPSLTINKVRAPVRAVLNQERQSELGVQVIAADDFGEGVGPQVSDEELELREGLVRRIQRDSQAQDARSWAFARAVIAGRGYWRVMTKFAPGRSADQDIVIERLYNQASVSLDPAHEQPDGSDAAWGFIGSDIPYEQYVRDYGELDGAKNPVSAASANEWRALGDELPGWFSTERETRSARIVEYWYTDYESTELVHLMDGRAVPKAEMVEGVDVPDLDEDGALQTHTETTKRIKWVKMDGVQILDETDWPGQYLPIVKVVGEELQPFDSQRRSEGLVRPSRDSQRSYNVMVSKWVEQIGLAPIPPWMGPAGFDEGFEQEYALANTRALSALHYNFEVNGKPLPAPPTRTPITTEIQAIAASVQLFDQSIRDTTAVPDVTLGNIDPALKRAGAGGIKAALDQAQQGTSHFLDNLQRSIRYEGLIINDLLYPIYGRKGRIARMMAPSGETQAVPLHVPFVPHPETQQPMTAVPHPMPGMPPMPVPGNHPQAKLYTLTKGAAFNVTINVTKNKDTRREQVESLLSTIVQADPGQLAIVGDLLFKYSDAEGHEELEDRYKAMLAPPIQAIVNKGAAPDPKQLQAQIAQLQGQLKQIQPLADANQAKVVIAREKNQTDLKEADINAQAKVVVAEISAKSEQMLADVKAQMQVLSVLINTVKEERLAEKQHAHEALKALHGAAHDVGLASMTHAHDTLQAAQDHQNMLEQGQQAADLAPPPMGTDQSGVAP
jgi:hypothetical protein